MFVSPSSAHRSLELSVSPCQDPIVGVVARKAEMSVRLAMQENMETLVNCLFAAASGWFRVDPIPVC
jgi:hypothetical protein